MLIPYASPVDFMEARFRIPDGHHKGKPMLARDVPWFVKPLTESANPQRKTVTCLKATGAGGTTLGEVMFLYQFMRRPTAYFLYNVHVSTNNKTEGAQTRLFSDQLDRIPELSIFNLVKNKNIRRITGPGSAATALVQPANKSSAQSTRASYILNDELHEWDPSVYYEMLERGRGDFPYLQIINVSSAARSELHPLHTEYEAGCQDEFHLRCKCGQLIMPLPGEFSMENYGMYVFQWPKEGSNKDKAANTVLICPSCSREYKDTPRNRRDILLDGAEYVSANPTAPIDYYSCRFNAFVPWFQSWGEIIEKYLDGLDRGRLVGDWTEMTDCCIKNFAITWSKKYTGNSRDIYISADYQLVERFLRGRSIWCVPDNDPDWIDARDDTGEFMRYMAVDYQRNGDLWVMILQTDPGANMRLMWAGRIGPAEKKEFASVKQNDWSSILHLQEFFKVPSYRVAVDAATDADNADIYRHCALNGWHALNGMDRQFDWKEIQHDENGYPYEETRSYPYQQQKRKGEFYHPETGENHTASFFAWDKLWITNIFDAIRTGSSELVRLHLPSNLKQLDRHLEGKQKILEQLNSMEFGPGGDKGRSLRKDKEFWHRRTTTAQEHLWDCASMIIALMCIDYRFESIVDAHRGDAEAKRRADKTLR